MTLYSPSAAKSMAIAPKMLNMLTAIFCANQLAPMYSVIGIASKMITLGSISRTSFRSRGTAWRDDVAFDLNIVTRRGHVCLHLDRFPPAALESERRPVSVGNSRNPRLGFHSFPQLAAELLSLIEVVTAGGEVKA